MDESQPTTLSVEQCKDLLRTIAKMLCVKAELISTRLLSAEDKVDMQEGKIPVETLIVAVKVWMRAGMPDYAKGSDSPYKEKYGLPMQRYRGHVYR